MTKAMCGCVCVSSKKKIECQSHLSVQESMMTLNGFHVMRLNYEMFSFFYSSVCFAHLYLCDCALAFAFSFPFPYPSSFAFAFENRFSSSFRHTTHIWMVYNGENRVSKIHLYVSMGFTGILESKNSASKKCNTKACLLHVQVHSQ